MTALVEDGNSDLPSLIREECEDLPAQITGNTARITEGSRKPTALAAQLGHSARQDTPTLDHAGCRADDGPGSGSVRA